MEKKERIVVVMVVVVVVSVLGGSEGKVHKVGGSAGWTILGNVDYAKWASSDSFHVGDSLLFEYNNQFHNVKQVRRRDFLSCNASSAKATYTSGSDTVALTRPGHYYYLCGFPGHCQAGQKLHVLVTSLPPSPSPSPSGSAVASPQVSAQNAAISAVSGVLAAAISGLLLLLVY